jgi:SOS-response transcriptional repressor LexA
MSTAASAIDTDWILGRLKERGQSIASLARAVGRDRAAMSRIVNGEQPWQPAMTSTVAEQLGVTDAELLSRLGLLSNEVTSIPMLPWYCAGLFALSSRPIPLTNEGGGVLLLSGLQSATLIALQVEDCSLERTIPKGSVIVVDYSRKELPDWSIGVFAFGSGAYLRRFRREGQHSWLVKEDFRGAEERIDAMDVAVVGMVVGIPKLAAFAQG